VHDCCLHGTGSADPRPYLLWALPAPLWDLSLRLRLRFYDTPKLVPFASSNRCFLGICTAIQGGTHFSEHLRSVTQSFACRLIDQPCLVDIIMELKKWGAILKPQATHVNTCTRMHARAYTHIHIPHLVFSSWSHSSLHYPCLGPPPRCTLHLFSSLALSNSPPRSHAGAVCAAAAAAVVVVAGLLLLPALQLLSDVRPLELFHGRGLAPCARASAHSALHAIPERL